MHDTTIVCIYDVLCDCLCYLLLLFFFFFLFLDQCILHLQWLHYYNGIILYCFPSFNFHFLAFFRFQTFLDHFWSFSLWYLLSWIVYYLLWIISIFVLFVFWPFLTHFLVFLNISGLKSIALDSLWLFYMILHHFTLCQFHSLAISDSFHHICIKSIVLNSV